MFLVRPNYFLFTHLFGDIFVTVQDTDIESQMDGPKTEHQTRRKNFASHLTFDRNMAVSLLCSFLAHLLQQEATHLYSLSNNTIFDDIA